MKKIAIIIAAVSFSMGCSSGASEQSDEALTTSSSSEALTINDCRNILNNIHPIPTVRAVQIVSDLSVQSGGASADVDAYAVNGDTKWAGFSTCVGVFNALLTSDPSTGGTLQTGVIFKPSSFTLTTATVSINPAGLAPGSYWLRFVTRLPDGTNDAAEGTLMVH